MLTIYRRLTRTWTGWGLLGALALFSAIVVASASKSATVTTASFLVWAIVGCMLPPMRAELWRLRSADLRNLAGDSRRAHAEFVNAGSALSDETGLTVVEHKSFVDEEGQSRNRAVHHRTRLSNFHAVPSGVAFVAAPPIAYGLTADDVVAARVRLEAWWAARLGPTVRVAVARESAASATVTVRLRDPLTEWHSAPTPDAIYREADGRRGAARRRPCLLGYDDEAVELRIDLGVWHTLLVGTTGSGKSAALYYPLASLAGQSDFVVVGVDPSGILLSPWAEVDSLPAWFALGTGNLPHAASVLERAVTLMDRRIAWLASHGQDKMSADDGFPTVIVVLEEFHALLAATEVADLGARPADRLRPRVLAAVGRLLRESRKVNMVVTCAIQRLDAVLIGGGDRTQYARRISFRADSTDSARMVMESATADDFEQMMSALPGQGFISEPGSYLRRFRTVNFSYSRYLDHVRGYAGSASARLNPEIMGIEQ